MPRKTTKHMSYRRSVTMIGLLTLLGIVILLMSTRFATGAAAPSNGPEAQGSVMPREDVLRFGGETLLDVDERMINARAVNFSPADGQIAALNPPRFRWQYNPTVPGAGGDFLFCFQVASDPMFATRVVDVETEFNFYNTISPFDGPGPWYWRIGYRDRGASDGPFEWSAVRSFTIAPDAQVWDRSMLARPDVAAKGHPRMLFNAETLPKLRELVRTHPESKVTFERIRAGADAVLETQWYRNMPPTDTEPLEYGWVEAAHALAQVAFVWRVTGDDRYASVMDRAVTMARYPKGGRSGPQGAGGDSAEDSTQTSEFLGLLYDWLYHDLDPAEKRDFAASLDWRIDSFINGFSWRSRDGDGKLAVRGGSLSTIGGSHPFEGSFDTFPAALAAYEDSPAAREAFHLILNYMTGVGCPHGFEEGWNEGPGYANSKWSWQVNSMSYLDSVYPEFAVGSNPWIIRLGEFLRLQTPVGIGHAPWGHNSNRRAYYETGHRRSYRKLAYLTGDGRFLANWHQYATIDSDLSRPWIECALPLWRERPEPVVEEMSVDVFPLGGWVTALSGPPSDPDTYNKGVGMIFAARPLGAYSHSFACDNSFQIFAYGQDLTHAAADSAYTACGYHSMSHNTILIDGLGQGGARSMQNVPWYSRIMAWSKRDKAVYWCGDATMSYPRKPMPIRHWWGALSDVYEKSALDYATRVNRHVLFVRDKYFVILDDLEAEKPARWTWLYHVLDSDRFDLDSRTGSISYVRGGVEVVVAQMLGAGALEVEDRRQLDGLINPMTGEDYVVIPDRPQMVRRMTPEHNVWLTTREPRTAWRFLTVIYPVAPGAQAPAIERLDDLTIRVSAGGESDVISFDGGTAHAADIIVDLESIAPAGKH